ncbi:hypothetical protein [Luedemannella helvata]|uniref:Uncharacterized protein n=1 Tax=Luedemannella helvata TaxID=349315 RepID=A0ABP4W4P9_9ACTN
MAHEILFVPGRIGFAELADAGVEVRVTGSAPRPGRVLDAIIPRSMWPDFCKRSPCELPFPV